MRDRRRLFIKPAGPTAVLSVAVIQDTCHRSAVGPAGGKSALGKSSSIPHKNLLTVLLAAPQGVTLSSNVAPWWDSTGGWSGHSLL